MDARTPDPAVDPVAGRVVVGYDGSDPSAAALHWAARLAQRYGTGLGVVVAQEVVVGSPHEVAWAAGAQDLLADAGQQLADSAASLVHDTHPDVPVATSCAWGSPAALLVDASTTAGCVVVGSRGGSGWGQLLLGSVSAAVAQHAHCPVVVVRNGCNPTDGGPVVVGVDGSPESAAAALAAFRFAAAFGVGVRVVHAWTLAFHGGVVPTDPGSEATQALEQDAHHAIDRAIEAAAREYPDVPVERLIRQGTPSRVLVETANGTDGAHRACLVVVGSRGRGGFRGLLLGSTSRNVLLHTDLPVAVVRPRPMH